MQNKENPDREWIRDFSLFGVIISSVLVATFGGLGLGYLGWSRWSWPKWLIAVFGFVGFFLGVYRVYLLYKRLDREREP